VTDLLVRKAGEALEKRTSRRGLLVRLALAGSALTIAPLRYLLRPESAWAVVTCRGCSAGSRCCDGWTTFCCTINNGLNSCPAYAYVGGWWKCTSYGGARLCRDTNVRYYIDCNRIPGTRCPGGCHCAGGNCHNRSTCCNVFRYGQCNTHIGGVTEVVCRVIKCVNPCELYDFCDCTPKVDNLTCGHEATCL